VTAALAEISNEIDLSDHFFMPKLIEGKTDILIAQINEHAKVHRAPLILDCSKLEKVEFGASATLLNGLVPISTAKDTFIQFVNVNYLVIALFNAMGLKNVATISPRKH